MKDRNLKSTIIHLKSLDQHFDEPIVAGAGNVNGRSIIVKLEQETLKQMTTGITAITRVSILLIHT